MTRILVFLTTLFFVTPLFAATLKPESVEQFFVAPNTESVIRFQITGEISGTEIESVEFKLVGSDIKIPAKIDGQTVSVTVSLPQGFVELEAKFENRQQRFGIVSLPAFEGTPDKFFAIDAAMSWLVDDEKFRVGLVKAAKRSGIGMIRERLSWNDIEPQKEQFDWETHRRYDSVRKLCQEHGIEVLELFHNAPNWMEKIEKYPADLVQTAKSWDAVAAHWNSTWGGFEIWNEPEIFFGGELPADQYVPVVKAIAYRLNKSGIKTPLFGGVMAHFHPAWLQTAAENGLLSAVDGFSFHTYDRAPSMEKLVGNYRHWLAKSGHEFMPLWLTECGRPWKRGPERPPAEQDLESAVDITMKGVEARCCGVDRYFPFVYPYYDENESNFGMMDKQGTPCQSMAAYTQLIRILSNTFYLGDLKIDDPAILRARLFSNVDKKEIVAVLYTGELKEPQKIKLPGKIKRIESVTGSPITPENNELSLIATNLYYVWFEPDIIVTSRVTKTEALELYLAIRKPIEKPAKPIEKICSVAIRFEYDKEKISATPDGYFISPNAGNTEAGNTLPLTFRVFNLGEEERKYQLHFEIGKTAAFQKEVVVAGQKSADVVWNFPFDKANLSGGDFQTFRITADDEVLLVLKIRGEATWDGMVSTAKNVQLFPVNNLALWQKNAPPICELNLETPPESEGGALWRMTATFTGEGDRWVYPRFPLPDDIDLTQASGILIEARCIGNATPRFFLFEKSGAGYIDGPVVPADGNWHIAKLPFARFQHAGATPPDANNQLDLDQVNFISPGVNSNEPKCTLEIKRIGVYQ